jgi:hypothetical protein
MATNPNTTGIHHLSLLLWFFCNKKPKYERLCRVFAQHSADKKSEQKKF